MRATKGIFWAWALVFSFFYSSSRAQNMTSSPYSMFGIGTLETGTYGLNASMGGVAYGMRAGNLLNNDNPAALTALDSSRLVADVSAFASVELYDSKKQETSSLTGNFGRIALGARILKSWYAALGIVPYSSVGYCFQSDQPLEGTSSSFVTSTFDGSGGLSKLYLSNAFRITRHWSVGVNLSYIFGNLLQTETQSSMYVVQKMSGSSFYADGGIQYHIRLDKHTDLTVGVVYGYNQRLNFSHTVSAVSSSGGSTEKKRKVEQYLPEYYGIGAGVRYKKMVYGLDYALRRYSRLSSLSSTVGFRDMHELKAGVCYIPYSYSSTGYWNKVDYKAGLSVSNSYMRISGKDGVNLRLTLGAAFPLFSNSLGVALFYDRTTFSGNVLNKEALGLTLTYTLSERLYRVKLD